MAILTDRVELTRLAWSEYAEHLQGLTGVEYDRAEEEAWGRLQAALGASGTGTLHPSEPIE